MPVEVPQIFQSLAAHGLRLIAQTRVALAVIKAATANSAVVSNTNIYASESSAPLVHEMFRVGKCFLNRVYVASVT